MTLDEYERVQVPQKRQASIILLLLLELQKWYFEKARYYVEKKKITNQLTTKHVDDQKGCATSVIANTDFPRNFNNAFQTELVFSQTLSQVSPISVLFSCVVPICNAITSVACLSIPPFTVCHILCGARRKPQISPPWPRLLQKQRGKICLACCAILIMAQIN